MQIITKNDALEREFSADFNSVKVNSYSLNFGMVLYDFRQIFQKIPLKSEIMDEQSIPAQKQNHDCLSRSASLPDKLQRDGEVVAGLPKVMII